MKRCIPIHNDQKADQLSGEPGAHPMSCAETGQTFLTQQHTSILWISQSTINLLFSHVKQL
jgi:hypothetical protein